VFTEESGLIASQQPLVRWRLLVLGSACGIAMRGYEPTDLLYLRQCRSVPSWELTYPPKWHFEDDFLFPKVGYVSSLEDNC